MTRRSVNITRLQTTALALLFLPQPFIAAAELGLLVSADTQKRLLAGEMLSAVYFEEADLALLPRHGALQQMVQDVKNGTRPGFIIESIGLYKKPLQERAWNTREKTALFNGLVSLSTLANLKYYSASRKQMRIFYETSEVIDTPERRRPVADPVFTPQSLPETLTLFAKQKDLTFGENIYRFDFMLKDDAILFTQTNLSTVYYGIIPVLGKNKLRSAAAALDAGDYIVIYMVSMADAFSIPGMKNRVSASFSARSEAALRWFNEKARAAY